MGFETSNQLTSGPYIDKSPGTIFLVHGIFVGLAHEAKRTELWLGQIVEGSRKPPHLAVVELHAAGVLLPAPDHLFFFFAPAFGQDARREHRRGNEQERGEEDDQEQSISMLAAPPCRSWTSSVHADGGAPCSSRLAVPRSPEETSSYSRLALPILRIRKRFSKSSPSATM